MKVLSLMEPWASLLREKVKTIETRSFRTNYRGELYIHASLKKVNKKDENALSLINYLSDKELKYGYIIAKCSVLDCIYMDENFVETLKREKPVEFNCGEYKVGRFAWILSDIFPLNEPIKAKGSLGIWNFECDI